MKGISKSELEFLSEASEQFDRCPHIQCFRGSELVAFRGYRDEVELYRIDSKVATFTDQIKEVKKEENNND